MIVSLLADRSPVNLYNPPLVWQDVLVALQKGLSTEQLAEGREKVGFCQDYSVRREDNVNTPPWRGNGRQETEEILARFHPDMTLSKVDFSDFRFQDGTWLVHASFRYPAA